MSTASVPNWTPDGVLPPINVLDPSSVHRSPYRVDLTDFVLRFAVSEARRQVLDGFIRYRRALHEAGLRKGFQWLNGSFAEDVERVEGRPPNDVDVVTFYELPEGTTQRVIAEKNPQLLNPTEIREKYNVDGYFVSLGSCPDRLVRKSIYWYSVWSHRRTMTWKGYIEISLNPTQDQAAWDILRTSSDMGDEE